MCTAITYKGKNNYFGRTLDIEYSYNEAVTITPRNFSLNFRKMGTQEKHYAIIGMAAVVDNYPLYYDAANEYGLSVAGLHFPENAHYFPEKANKNNIAPFEFIPFILSSCKNLDEARKCLSKISLCKINFSDELPLTPMHWLIADSSGSITVESVSDGLKIHNNPVGVLTNNPTFDYHITHLCDYINLTHKPAENRFADIALTPYSRGMGAIGLPGDLSSASRFVRAAFVKLNSVAGDDENSSISQFFHILGAVEQQRGCVLLPDGSYEITEYTSCINTDKGIYYYTTYENNCISAVNMHNANLDSTNLYSYPLVKKQIINRQN